MNIKKRLLEEFKEADNKIDFLNEIKTFIHQNLSPYSHNPTNCVKWVKIDKVVANDYNPNQVAENELELLYTSISQDGYTQPIVTIYDEEQDTYVIVDGFHRYFVMKSHKDLLKENRGRVPIVVISSDINQRMASTVRHNRARGKHTIDGMADVVFRMLDNGWTDEEICQELGMEADELVRLKHITGFSKLFEDVEYRKAWEHKKQIRMRKEYNEDE